MKNFKIYCIENLVNNKKYIGKTSKTIEKRFKKHINNAQKKINRRLYDSMNFHGYDNFKVYLICEADSNENANLKEIKYIKQYNTKNPKFGYNMTNGGDGGNTGKYYYGKSPYDWFVEKYGIEVANEMKKEISKKISQKNKGIVKILSKESKNKISETLKEKYKSGELIPNLPKVKIGKSHHNWINVELNEIVCFMRKGKTLRWIAIFFNCSEFVIRDRIKKQFNKTFFEMQKEMKLNNFSENEIVNHFKFHLENYHYKTVLEIATEINIKLHICKKIFKKETGMTFEEYRIKIVGIPLSKYGRKINSITLEDIEKSFEKGCFKLKEVAINLNVKTDLIQDKIKKSLNINFTQFKNKFYEKNNIK